MAQNQFSSTQNKFSNNTVPLARPPTGNTQRPFSPPQRANTFDDAIKILLASIKNREPKNFNSLIPFFATFDAYEARDFSDWELKLIFPDVDSSVFAIIHDKNSQTAKIKKGEIQLGFLINELQFVEPNLIRQSLPKQSPYMTQQVSEACSNLLVKFAQNKHVQYQPSVAYDELFTSQPSVDARGLDRAFRNMQIETQLSELPELVSYFALSHTANSFNKIQFCQGITPWKDNLRPQPQQLPTTQLSSTMQFQSSQQNTYPLQTTSQQASQIAPLHHQASLPQGPFPQDAKYTDIIFSFGVDLEILQKCLTQRHTGVYGWFSSQSNGGSQLTLMEFTKAVQTLDPTVRSAQDIYSALQFQGRNFNVLTEDVEGLFKAYSRRNKPEISSNSVLDRLLEAFNTDDQFIVNALYQIKPLTTTQFVQFFAKFPDGHQFYSLNHITLLAETYAQQDLVNLTQFQTDLVARRRNTNIQKKLGFNGVHAQQTQLTLGAMNEFMPDFSSDNTRAAQQPNERPPRSFMPHSDDTHIHDIIKACFINNKSCFDHFVSFGTNGLLTMNHFASAISALGCQQPPLVNDQLFRSIDASMNGVPRGQVQAAEIDQYVHFSCRKQLNQLHNDLLQLVEQQVQLRNFNLVGEFSLTGKYGRPECSFQEFKNVLFRAGLNWSEQDLLFVAKKYQAGQSLHYQKFVDDISQISRINLHMRIGSSPTDVASLVAESVKKQMHVNGSNFEQLLNEHTFRPLSQSDFLDIFGQRLQMVPRVCNQQSLSEIYKQLPGSQTDQVSAQEVSRFFDLKCPKSVNQLLKQECNKLQNFNLTLVFQAKPNRLLMSDFIFVLTSQLAVSQLDASFVAQCFQRGGDVDVVVFLQECQSNQGKNKQPILGLLQQIANAATQRRLELNRMFSQHRVADSVLIPIFQFTSEVQSIVNLTAQERDQLESVYRSLEGDGMINYLEFLEDVRNQSRNFDRNQVALTKSQQVVYDGIRDLLIKHKMEADLAQRLKTQDALNQGFIQTEQFVRAVQDTLLSVPSQSAKRQQLSTAQLNDVTSAVSTDSLGRLNWHNFLTQLFGYQQAQRLINSNTAISSVQPVMMQGESFHLSAIGKKIGVNQLQQFVQVLTQLQKGQQNGVPLVLEMDISAALQSLAVFLSVDERNELEAWCRKSMDSQQLISSHTLLKALGFQQPEQKKTSKRILSSDELLECQKFLQLIRRELIATGVTPEQVVAKYRQPTDTTMTPKNFKSAIVRELSSNQAVMSKANNNALMTNTVYYLVREQLGHVSYAKLLQAFNQRDQEPPLAQEMVEDLAQYQSILKNQLISRASAPLSVSELAAFMKKQGLSLQTLLQIQTANLNQDILTSTFEQKLNAAGYYPKEMLELVTACQNTSTPTNKVSLEQLQKHLRALAPKQSSDPATSQQNYGRINASVRAKIQLISAYMQRNNITIEQLHRNLDVNNDGSVDKMEFVQGLSKLLQYSISQQDLATIFDAIDINNDHFLSVNEFGYYLQGAKLQKEQKKAMLDQATINEVKREILALFLFFSQKSGYCTSNDIQKALSAMGNQISSERAQEIVRTVDKDGDNKITEQEFEQLMLPILLDEVVSGDSQVEDMRARFKEADTDYSGHLSVNEFYTCLLGMGADVSRQEIVNLFSEFDANQDMQIDIDEFIQFFSVGEQLEFQDEGNMHTYNKIKKARKLGALDFLKAFNAMPQTFTPSFFSERWTKTKRNLPSSVIRAQIDPKTMLYKDMAPVLTEHLTPEQKKPENQPRFRPVATVLGAQITVESAEGVPLPASSSDFDRQNIVKRVVRIGLYDKVKHDLIANSCQILAEWNQANEDVWSFSSTSAASLNPVLFRTTQADDLNRQEVVLIFELVVYVFVQNKTTEMTAGWAEAPISYCEKDQSKVKLEIKGGSPDNQLTISKDDLQTRRTGVKAFMKLLNSNITSTLIVSFKPERLLEPETKVHMEMLPSTCLIQKKMLNLVSGYRNYAADILLPETLIGSLKQPIGNKIMSTFPKVLDCPDLLEVVAQIWFEDHYNQMTQANKKSIAVAIQKTEEIISRVYPLLFSDVFGYSAANATESLCGDKLKVEERRKLAMHALRYNNASAKQKVNEPMETLTSFKPFNIREIEFDVWNSSEQYVR